MVTDPVSLISKRFLFASAVYGRFTGAIVLRDTCWSWNRPAVKNHR
jgi:hypothetical protein